jgi:hypothetical protein
MDESKDLNLTEQSRPLQIWCCDSCESVHFKAGNVLLNFTKDEFAELVYGVNDVFQSEFGNLEFYHLVSSLSAADEVLSSSLIS